MTVTALLLLGANRGSRAGNLRRAVARFRRTAGCRVLGVSRIYETAPVGPSQRPYLNQAVRLSTTRTPMGLLLEAKMEEAAAGRRPGKRWGARALDVDLISYGMRRIRTPWLTVPHPRVIERPFALAPLCDVAPRWKPDGRRTAAAWLTAWKPDARIVKLWSHG
jgi:2-amino-4-hydroxy-6-hydroxymethyldihydropteridine diphosphokinase